MANGRCRMHGGKNKGADPEKLKRNKNAVKTGEFESIFADVLNDDELESLQVMKIDVLEQLNGEIKLITIRERRMMKRIQDIVEQNPELKLKKESANGKIVYTDVQIPEGMMVVGDNYSSGFDAHMIDMKPKLELIQSIEDALTRVQDKKLKMIELKHRIETDGDGDDEEDGLSSLKEAIQESTKLLKLKKQGVDE